MARLKLWWTAMDKNYINGHQTIYQPSQEGTVNEKAIHESATARSKL